MELERMRLQKLTLFVVFTVFGCTWPAQAENVEHTQQLLSTKSCQRCELSGAGLIFAVLSGADLRGANLSGANLSRADLSGADLSGANLMGASLFGANLVGANLEGADLRGADLRSALLTESNLTGSNLDQAAMQNAVGIPQTINTEKAEDFHGWAVAAAQKGNHREALRYYDQALAINPDYAPTRLGRSVSLFSVGNVDLAKQEAQRASDLFEEQENERGQEVSQDFITAVQTAEEEAQKRKKRGSGGGGFLNTLKGLVQSAASLALQFVRFP
jgi:uncharacterized protein YjbI with pentapeptide repeats